MALPLLKDFLPEPDFLQKTGTRSLPASKPEGVEDQALAGTRQRLAALHQAIETYVQRVRSARPSPEDVETIFQDFVSGQDEYLEHFRRELGSVEKGVERLDRNLRLITPAQQVRANLLRNAIAYAITLFEDAERELLTLRDQALIEETQASFGSRFWDDDDDG